VMMRDILHYEEVYVFIFVFITYSKMAFISSLLRYFWLEAGKYLRQAFVDLLNGRWRLIVKLDEGQV